MLKDANNKYFIEANSLQRYIDSCPDFNPYEIPGVYEPDNYDEDAPMDESVFILGAGGGLCAAMMLREKRRCKEELN